MAALVPASFQPGFQNNLRYDLPAGLVVFLVALPLCLGIALASGAPLLSGIIAGIVGGTLLSFASGSEVSVSGPAAGLAVIVAAAIQSLGDYRAFLAAVVLSGVFQIGFAALRGGVIGDYVPNCVIKGMLAGIGIVIILKQIPHALGRDADYIGDLEFFQSIDGLNTFREIALSVLSCNGEAIIISVAALAILILWETSLIKRVRGLSLLPAPLLAVIVGTLLNEAFRQFGGDFYLKREDGHLVSLPLIESAADFFKQLTFPSVGMLADRRVYGVAFTIALVGSLESLLSLEAANKLDPYKRIAGTNRELFAQGLGNIISGMVGGLPVTSVVVRTSANVYAGARTRAAAFFHGVFLLLAVTFISFVLNRIPLACLASVLLMVGYKLAKIELFKQIYKSGLDQFLPFIVTVVAIVFSDLLVGIGVGVAVGLFFVIRANHHAAITLVNQDDYYLIRFNKDISFVNKAELKEKLMQIPDNSKVIIDATKSLFTDHDIYEIVGEFGESAAYRNISVELKHFISPYALSK